MTKVTLLKRIRLNNAVAEVSSASKVQISKNHSFSSLIGFIKVDQGYIRAWITYVTKAKDTCRGEDSGKKLIQTGGGIIGVFVNR